MVMMVAVIVVVVVAMMVAVKTFVISTPGKYSAGNKARYNETRDGMSHF